MLIFDIHRFMHTVWALPLLLVCLFVPYSIGYVAETIRKREARRPTIVNGDASALIFARVERPEAQEQGDQSYSPKRGNDALVLWIVGAVVIAYGTFRVYLTFAYGATLDWTLVVAGLLIVALGSIAPSVLGWRHLQRTATHLHADGRVWPVFRTDQFSDTLHRFRPGALVPVDLALVVDGSSIAIFTTEREPRPLVSFPRDGSTSVSRASTFDRLGRTAIRIERKGAEGVSSFELIPRRRGVFTYFRSGESCAERTIQEIAAVPS